MNKSFFRALSKELKKEIDLKTVGKSASSKIKVLDCFINAKTIMLYDALPDEVDVSFLKVKNKTICMPCVQGDEILVKALSKDTVVGDFSIIEPMGRELSKNDIDVCIVPGVMFDKSFKRLGRGRGYYDRFLRDFEGVKIGITPEMLMIDSLPSDEYDIKMDIIVTESNLYIRG